MEYEGDQASPNYPRNMPLGGMDFLMTDRPIEWLVPFPMGCLPWGQVVDIQMN